MGDNNGKQEEGDPTKDIRTEGPAALSTQGQQTDTSHANHGSNHTQYKQRIAKWFRDKLGGHKPLEWLTFTFEVLTFIALCVYSYFSWGSGSR